MDILSAVANNSEPPKPVNRSTCDFATMHPDVFIGYLERLGLDADIIEDCFFEERKYWDSLLDYWERQINV
jgi:hypothetical protein